MTVQRYLRLIAASFLLANLLLGYSTVPTGFCSLGL